MGIEQENYKVLNKQKMKLIEDREYFKKYLKKLDEEMQEARETLNFIMEQMGI